MIVECISSRWYQEGKLVTTDVPIKGNLYEVIDTITCPCGCNYSYYTLREFPIHCSWNTENFREVDINIQDIEHVEVLEGTI